MDRKLILINKLEISTSNLLLMWVSLSTLCLIIYVYNPVHFYFLVGQHKTEEIVNTQRKLSHFGGFKVNGRRSLRGSKEIHGSLLSLLLSENIPEKGHGINNSRKLFQNSILGIFQIGRVTHSSGLKTKNEHVRLGCVCGGTISFSTRTEQVPRVAWK